jgi:pimeloyl-ACP methyl ester carboxylesterase
MSRGDHPNRSLIDFRGAVLPGDLDGVCSVTRVSATGRIDRHIEAATPERNTIMSRCLFSSVLLTSLVTGCAWMYPTAVPMATEIYRASPAERAPILLVLLPGRGDSAADFAAHGFIDDVRASGLRVDVVAADAHFGYYLRGTIADRVWTDIIAPARRQGYQHIWLGGISMGGMGAIVSARAHPDAYERLFLLAPYVGPKDLLEHIEAAGGARAWTPTDPDDRYQKVWIWLKQYADPAAAARLPEMTVGFGTHDKLERGLRVLTQLLPAEQVHEIEGQHKWETWRPLWKTFWAPSGAAALQRGAPGAGGHGQNRPNTPTP